MRARSTSSVVPHRGNTARRLGLAVLGVAGVQWGLSCSGRDDTRLGFPVEASAGGAGVPGDLDAQSTEAGNGSTIWPPSVDASVGAGGSPPLVQPPSESVEEPPRPSTGGASPVTPPSGGNDGCAPCVCESAPDEDASVPAVPTVVSSVALAPFEQRCGAGGLTRSGAQGLARMPYLQRLSDSSVDIVYKRVSGGASDAVDISLPDGSLVAHVATVDDPGEPGSRQRLAHVEGLSPDTYYCYTVAALTERIGFRTAPAAGSGTVVRFAVFGDSGDGGIGQAAVRERLLGVPLDLLLHTGDVAYEEGTLDQFEQRFFRVYQGLLKSVPIFPVAGNHEHYTTDAAPYLEVFDLPDNGSAAGREYWYSFDYGDVHFVGLDTEQLGAEQTAWLDQDLTQNQRRWTVVYFHRPPFSSGQHGNSPDVEAAFAPTLQSHGVQLVFTGHDHDYERTRPIDGITYVITGGGGKLVLPVGSSEFTVASQRALHFVHVEVRSTRLRVRAIDAGGSEIDAFDIVAPG